MDALRCLAARLEGTSRLCDAAAGDASQAGELRWKDGGEARGLHIAANEIRRVIGDPAEGPTLADDLASLSSYVKAGDVFDPGPEKASPAPADAESTQPVNGVHPMGVDGGHGVDGARERRIDASYSALRDLGVGPARAARCVGMAEEEAAGSDPERWHRALVDLVRDVGPDGFAAFESASAVEAFRTMLRDAARLGEATGGEPTGTCSCPECGRGPVRFGGRCDRCGSKLEAVVKPPPNAEPWALGEAQRLIDGLNLFASEGKRIGWPQGERKPVALADLGLTVADLASMSPMPPPGPWRDLVERAQAETPASLCAIAAEATRATDAQIEDAAQRLAVATGGDADRIAAEARRVALARENRAAVQRCVIPERKAEHNDPAPALCADIEEQRISHGGCTRLPREMLAALGVKDGDLVWFLRSTPGGRWEVWTADELDADLGIGRAYVPPAGKTCSCAEPRRPAWCADCGFAIASSTPGPEAQDGSRVDQTAADPAKAETIPPSAPPVDCPGAHEMMDVLGSTCSLCGRRSKQPEAPSSPTPHEVGADPTLRRRPPEPSAMNRLAGRAEKSGETTPAEDAATPLARAVEALRRAGFNVTAGRLEAGADTPAWALEKVRAYPELDSVDREAIAALEALCAAPAEEPPSDPLEPYRAKASPEQRAACLHPPDDRQPLSGDGWLCDLCGADCGPPEALADELTAERLEEVEKRARASIDVARAEDVDFIAAARTDVPVLSASVLVLAAEVKRLHGELGDVARFMVESGMFPRHGDGDARWRGLEHEVAPHRTDLDTWVVEAVDHASEGEIYAAHFSGPGAEGRARAYARWASARDFIATLPEEPAAPKAGPRIELRDGAEVTVGSYDTNACTEYGPVHDRICTVHIGGQHVSEDPDNHYGNGSWRVIERWPIVAAKPDPVPDPVHELEKSIARITGDVDPLRARLGLPPLSSAAPQKPERVEPGQVWRCVGVEGELVVRNIPGPGERNVELESSSTFVYARPDQMLGLPEWTCVRGPAPTHEAEQGAIVDRMARLLRERGSR